MGGRVGEFRLPGKFNGSPIRVQADNAADLRLRESSTNRITAADYSG